MIGLSQEIAKKITAVLDWPANKSIYFFFDNGTFVPYALETGKFGLVNKTSDSTSRTSFSVQTNQELWNNFVSGGIIAATTAPIPISGTQEKNDVVFSNSGTPFFFNKKNSYLSGYNQGYTSAIPALKNKILDPVDAILHLEKPGQQSTSSNKGAAENIRDANFVIFSGKKCQIYISTDKYQQFGSEKNIPDIFPNWPSGIGSINAAISWPGSDHLYFFTKDGRCFPYYATPLLGAEEPRPLEFSFPGWKQVTQTPDFSEKIDSYQVFNNAKYADRINAVFSVLTDGYSDLQKISETTGIDNQDSDDFKRALESYKEEIKDELKSLCEVLGNNGHTLVDTLFSVVTGNPITDLNDRINFSKYVPVSDNNTDLQNLKKSLQTTVGLPLKEPWEKRDLNIATNTFKSLIRASDLATVINDIEKWRQRYNQLGYAANVAYRNYNRVISEAKAEADAQKKLVAGIILGALTATIPGGGVVSSLLAGIGHWAGGSPDLTSKVLFSTYKDGPSVKLGAYSKIGDSLGNNAIKKLAQSSVPSKIVNFFWKAAADTGKTKESDYSKYAISPGDDLVENLQSDIDRHFVDMIGSITRYIEKAFEQFSKGSDGENNIKAILWALHRAFSDETDKPLSYSELGRAANLYAESIRQHLLSWLDENFKCKFDVKPFSELSDTFEIMMWAIFVDGAKKDKDSTCPLSWLVTRNMSNTSRAQQYFLKKNYQNILPPFWPVNKGETISGWIREDDLVELKNDPTVKDMASLVYALEKKKGRVMEDWEKNALESLNTPTGSLKPLDKKSSIPNLFKFTQKLYTDNNSPASDDRTLYPRQWQALEALPQTRILKRFVDLNLFKTRTPETEANSEERFNEELDRLAGIPLPPPPGGGAAAQYNTGNKVTISGRISEKLKKYLGYHYQSRLSLSEWASFYLMLDPMDRLINMVKKP